MLNTQMDRPVTPAVEDWAGEMGARWLAGIDQFESMIAPIGIAFLARGGFVAGERVLDLGCGGGATSLEIAALVGPVGSVTGIDISPDLVGKARERAKSSGLQNTKFECVDASIFRPAVGFDRMVSRFGSMFFPEPVAAFTNLHRCLKPGGRIDLAVWGPPRENPWLMEMMGVLRRHIDVPPAVPRAPGPFAFEDADYLSSILIEAGFGDIESGAYEGLLPMGGAGASPHEAVDFAMASLAAGRLMQDQTEDLQSRVKKDLMNAYAHHHLEGQGVMMAAKAWLVTARA